ncbi:hypothetical protein CRM22_009736 [Opisthorchis felineus]|uniref:Uncharacterized protein n=1 Tax=Opisthorchis felineus TaxID=147828 RepID=A0A4S2LD21_OPIFE|nr:hypothetical protein CRM22_009736 [Opisthorchis felineus]
MHTNNRTKFVRQRFYFSILSFPFTCLGMMLYGETTWLPFSHYTNSSGYSDQRGFNCVLDPKLRQTTERIPQANANDFGDLASVFIKVTITESFLHDQLKDGLLLCL